MSEQYEDPRIEALGDDPEECECPYCHGERYVIQACVETPCPHCSGAGWVPNPDLTPLEQAAILSRSISGGPAIAESVQRSLPVQTAGEAVAGMEQRREL